MPLIVNQLGRVPARQIANQVYFPDFMPTLAALTGSTNALPQTDGIDVSPLFFGGNVDTDHRYLYWEFPGKQRAVRYGEWKCVTVKKGAPLELYHISEDPNEQHNLADQYPKMVKFWCRNGQIYLDSHPDVQVAKMFADVYEWFVCNTFYKDYDSFRAEWPDGRVSGGNMGLFSLNRDCKQFLEEYFKIKF